MTFMLFTVRLSSSFSDACLAERENDADWTVGIAKHGLSAKPSATGYSPPSSPHVVIAAQGVEPVLELRPVGRSQVRDGNILFSGK
jgi:hypothetical protein